MVCVSVCVYDAAALGLRGLTIDFIAGLLPTIVHTHRSDYITPLDPRASRRRNTPVFAALNIDAIQEELLYSHSRFSYIA